MYLSKYSNIYDLSEENSLIINSLSGALDIISNSTKNKLNKIQNGSYAYDIADTELVDKLITRGHIYDDKNKEDEQFNNLMALYNNMIKEIPINFVICPTMECNLRCTYCFESTKTREEQKVMTSRQIQSIFKHIDTIVDVRKPKKFFIELFGGEPLLPSTFDVNRMIFQYAREKGVKVSMITNGTHVTHYKDLFMEFKDIIESLQITVDGIKEVHDKRRVRIDKSGTFDVICKGIQTLLDMGIAVKVRVNVDGENIDSLPEIRKYFSEKGWDKRQNFYTDIAPVTDHIGTKSYDKLMPEHEMVKRIEELFPDYNNSSGFQLKMFRVLNHINKVLGLNNDAQESLPSLNYCEANTMQFYVFSPDGNIYACPESVGDPLSAIGKYDKELNLDNKAFEKWNNRNIFTIPMCKDCKIAPFCGGGCAYGALKTNGDINYPICENAELVLRTHIHNIKDFILKKYS